MKAALQNRSQIKAKGEIKMIVTYGKLKQEKVSFMAYLLFITTPESTEQAKLPTEKNFNT